MALSNSQILIFNPSTVPKSPVSRTFRHVTIHRRSSSSSDPYSLPFSSPSINVSAAAALQEYVYPDPDPEFAESEVLKFRVEMRKKLAKEKEEFGNSLNDVVNVCEQVLREFLLTEYGGPGTFVVEPFTYILVLLKDKKLPGATLAARASLLWAQNHLDNDWNTWISYHNIQKI